MYLACGIYSNTTLVKVKLLLTAIVGTVLADSNTTLVKVKYLKQIYYYKFRTIQIQHLLKLNKGWKQVHDDQIKFKYNTC